MAEPSLYFITAVLYAVLGFHGLALQRFARPAGPDGDRPADARDWQRIAVPVALALHATLLYRNMFGGPALDLSLGVAVSLILWVTGLIYWVGSFRLDLGALRTFILLMAGVSVIALYFLPSAKTVSYGGLTAFRVHVVIALLAYGLFTIAALHAILMALLERRLRSGTVPPMLQGLPPLLAMESLLFRMLWVAFALLTLTLVSGVFFSEVLFERAFTKAEAHKFLFAFIAWVIFAALLAGRQIYGWRGRRAVRWTLTGFGMLMIAYLGTKVVLELILHRP
jgi:ABC-type uncharacterized transport system permease subunit